MKNKLRLTFIFICIALLSFGETSVNGQGYGDRNRPAGRGTYRITGKVYLPDGSAAKDVSVSASGADFNNSSTRTDIDGNFTLPGLPSGNYNVMVRENGYQTETELLTISEGTISGQAFQLVFHLRTPGQPKRSASSMNPLLKDVPKEPLAKYNKAMEKIASGDAKSAVPLFDQAIATHPTFAAAYYERGAALLKLDETDKALESFVKAIQIKPDYLEAKYSVGYTQYLKKNYEVAAAVFDDVLKQKPDMPEAHMYLGMSLFNLKNIDAAEASLKKAVTVTGGDKLALAHLYLGQIYMQKKRNAEAAAELEKYLELVPKAPNAERLKTTITDLKKKA